jgi:hypothetical protein
MGALTNRKAAQALIAEQQGEAIAALVDAAPIQQKRRGKGA